MNLHDLVLLSRLRAVARGIEISGPPLQCADLSPAMVDELERLAIRISRRSRAGTRPLSGKVALNQILQAVRCEPCAVVGPETDTTQQLLQ
jgi:hypothetical protein